MTPHLYIFVNGILNKPGAHNGWTDRAVSWVHQHTGHQAEKFEYLTGALTRRFTQNLHAVALRSLINSYKGRPIHLVGHSNGCDIIVRALTGEPMLAQIASVHLIAGACEADFEKNGLNRLLLDSKVGRVAIYVGGQDKAMRAARVSQWVVGWLGLGFGTMGLTGPKNVDRALAVNVGQFSEVFMLSAEVTVINEPKFWHSTFFDKAHFEETMRRVTTHSLTTK